MRWVAGADDSAWAARNAFTARSMVTLETEIFSGTEAGNSPPQSFHLDTVSLAFSQSFWPVDLRLNLPPSVPEAKMRQAQRFQPFLRSSNSPERKSSGRPASQSRRCRR